MGLMCLTLTPTLTLILTPTLTGGYSVNSEGRDRDDDLFSQAGGGSDDGGWSDAGDDGARADSRQASDDDGAVSEME